MVPVSVGAAAAGAAAANAAAIQAIRACGVTVHLEEAEFLGFVRREPGMLVVYSESWLITRTYHYLTSYRGLAFYAKSTTPLPLPKGVEVIAAKSMRVL